MTFAAFLSTAFVVIEYVIKIVAIGVVPENRRPSSSTAWLLLILFLPVVGLPLFLLLGSATINRRRHRIQGEANQLLDEGLADRPTIPAGCEPPPGIGSLLHLNRRLTRRHWHDAMICVRGEIVRPIEAVFVVDWYTETGEQPLAERTEAIPSAAPVGGPGNAFQLVPSGSGFTTEPNLRLFTSLIHAAQERISICSPYFVPDESLLAAVTTAGYRGIDIELFVSEQADQFMVDHAQSSYYRALLEAGVRIRRYPSPAVLHTKFLVIDGRVAVIGSSNMDMRSFGLNYEISLLTFGGDAVTAIDDLAGRYRTQCRELTLAEWNERPYLQRYLDSVFRLTSALQ